MGYLLISRNVYQECTRTSNNQASLWPNIPCQPPSLDGNTGVRTGPPARCCCLWRDTVGCWPHCTQSSQRLSCFSSPCCRERTRYRCGTDYCIANLHSAIAMLCLTTLYIHVRLVDYDQLMQHYYSTWLYSLLFATESEFVTLVIVTIPFIFFFLSRTSYFFCLTLNWN